MDYETFLASKRIQVPSSGIGVAISDIHPQLFEWQKLIVQWALKRGRSAIFADCGLGKSFMQCSWSYHVHKHSSRDILILAPLAVTSQTIAEGAKLGIEIHGCRSQIDVRSGINIANYEMLERFDPDHFAGVVCDESSILKSFMGKTKRALCEAFKNTPYKLACTATPSPNDHMELLNQAEWLGIMKSSEALMRWFINDTMANGKYRLKGHATKDFWEWVASWAISLRKPSDIGFSDQGFELPELRLHQTYVSTDITTDTEQGQLFRAPTMSATTLHKEGRLTIEDKAKAVAELVNGNDDTWIIWVNTNYEADAIRKLIPDAVEVRGSESISAKERKLTDFSEGKTRVMLTKADIAGWGLNWQHCHKMVYFPDYSFEKLYQAVRRAYRYGQQYPVDVHIIAAETESALVTTLDKKMRAHMEMSEAMNNSAQLSLKEDLKLVRHEDFKILRGQDYDLYHGDCVQVARSLPDNSIHFSVFSPPFSSLYIYSDAIEDLGNCKDDEEFFKHFDYLIPELLRVTVPGRLCAVHCKDLVNYKGRDGMAGLRDFSGEIVRHFTTAGWAYHSKVVIWLDPVLEMQKTKAHGLLYKQLRADSTFSRMGIPEYMLIFRKWPQSEEEEANIVPVTHTKDDFPLEMWQRYASPVWMDIRRTNVLNVEQAREDRDTKHVCPLQLDVIERCLDLWTNPGETVFSPFAGIGSEGYVALKKERKFIGVELKEAYCQVARKNFERALNSRRQSTLWSFEEQAV